MGGVQHRRARGLALLGLSLSLVAIALLVEESLRGITLCGVKALFGLPCPFCGGLRATRALGRGEIGEALWWNPAATLLHAGLVVSGVSQVLGREPPWFAPGRQRRVFALAGAALVGNWIWLLAVGR